MTGAIDGVTLDLASVYIPATVTVSRDLNAATTAVQGFVDAFNALNSTLMRWADLMQALRLAAFCSVIQPAQCREQLEKRRRRCRTGCRL